MRPGNANTRGGDPWQPRRRLRSALVSLLLAACKSGSGDGAPAHPVDLAIVPYQGGYGSVMVDVAGKHLPFLLDPGGGYTVVSPAVATAAGCQPFGRLTGYRMRGQRLDFPKCEPFALDLGTIAITPPALGVFD